jgi:hypothetical protein
VKLSEAHALAARADHLVDQINSLRTVRTPPLQMPGAIRMMDRLWRALNDNHEPEQIACMWLLDTIDEEMEYDKRRRRDRPGDLLAMDPKKRLRVENLIVREFGLYFPAFATRLKKRGPLRTAMQEWWQGEGRRWDAVAKLMQDLELSKAVGVSHLRAWGRWRASRRREGRQRPPRS